MSVLFETSLGDIVIDLEVDNCPKTCENFLKLCKVYYYNLNAFFNVSKDFLAQAGDPTATGTGGESIWSYIASQSSSEISFPRYFPPEILPKLKHNRKGTVSMAVAPALEGQKGGCGSQFFITLADNIDYLDGKHAVFGHVVEGLETLDKLNEVFVDQDGRPFKDVRIRHVIVLDDPFDDPTGLIRPPASPTRPPDNSTRIAEDEDPLATLPEEEEEKIRREKAAAASALTLEMVGDLPFANVRPPENVLFVCKLNPVTRDEDLELIFSRFGTIMSCQVIRDKRTGDSLQYAFIEFDKREDAEQAYFKMQNVLVDDRRIWVDFSQSVARLNTHWSNDIVKGSRHTTRGAGYGGREDLAETKRYRADEDGPRIIDAKGVAAGTNTELNSAHLIDARTGTVQDRHHPVGNGVQEEIDIVLLSVNSTAARGSLRIGPVDMGGTERRIVAHSLAPKYIPTFTAHLFASSATAPSAPKLGPFLWFGLIQCCAVGPKTVIMRHIQSVRSPSSIYSSLNLAAFLHTLPLPFHNCLPQSMTFTSALDYTIQDPDIILLTCETSGPTEFYLHSAVLSSASPFFREMFTLPQAPHPENLPVIPVSESCRVMEILLNLVYNPKASPEVDGLQELSLVLGAAMKYDFTWATLQLRNLLMTPRFLQQHAIHVYAIASLYDLEDEMGRAAMETLKGNLLGGPPNEDLRYISAFDYHHLLHLHHRRVMASTKLLKCPEGVTCMQCNSSVSSANEPPMWWKAFAAMAKEEMDIRPTTDVVFGTKFLFKAVEKSGCPGCSESILHHWEVLMNIKQQIDQLSLS
ncbi:hypothetical protein CVT24_011872 [Panaeolus cyanescens]|uniref:peptidylprolyl isomerase n=1 Tax=Panaeolus cyanescens TaxID=181874 RepID=A0A409YP83_9AGAR|nr:hypothetical protein CVT24_011872 [Panaeolus cyanescens]